MNLTFRFICFNLLFIPVLKPTLFRICHNYTTLPEKCQQGKNGNISDILTNIYDILTNLFFLPFPPEFNYRKFSGILISAIIAEFPPAPSAGWKKSDFFFNHDLQK